MYCSVARTTTYDDGNTTVIVTKCSLEPDNHIDNVKQHDEPPAQEFLWGPLYQRSPYLLTKSKEQFLRREPKSSPGSSPGGKGQCPRISSSRRVGEGSSLMNKSYSIVRVHGFWSSMMLTNLNSQNHAWSFLGLDTSALLASSHAHPKCANERKFSPFMLTRVSKFRENLDAGA